MDVSDNQLNSQIELIKLGMLKNLTHLNLAYNHINSLQFLHECHLML